MELSKIYNPKNVESKWYEAWEKQKCFTPNLDYNKTFTIMIPPPNVTGILHMGHVLNNTIQDVLIRKERTSERCRISIFFLDASCNSSLSFEIAEEITMIKVFSFIFFEMVAILDDF